MPEDVPGFTALTAREQEDVRRILGRLLRETFVVRREAERRDFYLLERHQAVLARLLDLMGWDLDVDRVLGVARVIDRSGATRLGLRLWESVLLLVVRLLYEERRRDLNLTADVLATIQEVQDKCLALKLRDRAVLEKKHLREAFTLFRRFSLVAVLDGDVTAPDCRFVVYPSVLKAVPVEGIAELQARLAAYGEESADEAPDGDPADQLALLREPEGAPERQHAADG